MSRLRKRDEINELAVTPSKIPTAMKEKKKNNNFFKIPVHVSLL